MRKLLSILLCVNLLLTSFYPFFAFPGIVAAQEDESWSWDIGWNNVPAAETEPASVPQEQVDSCLMYGEGCQYTVPGYEVPPSVESTPEPTPEPTPQSCGEPQFLYNECSEECRVSHPVLQDSCGNYSFGPGQYDEGCSNNCPVSPEPEPAPAPVCNPDCTADWTVCQGETFDDGCGGTCNGSFAGSCDDPAALSVCTTETYSGTCGRVCSGLNDCTYRPAPSPEPTPEPAPSPTFEPTPEPQITPLPTAEAMSYSPGPAVTAVPIPSASSGTNWASYAWSPDSPAIYNEGSQDTAGSYYWQSYYSAPPETQNSFADDRQGSVGLGPIETVINGIDGVARDGTYLRPDGELQGGGGWGNSQSYKEEDERINDCVYETCDPEVGQKVCVESWVHKYIYSNFTDKSATYTKPGRVTGTCASKYANSVDYAGCQVKRVDECMDKQCDVSLGRNVCIEKWESICGNVTTVESKPGAVTNERCAGAVSSACSAERLSVCSRTECDRNLGLEVCVEQWTAGEQPGMGCSLVVVERPGVTTDKVCEYKPDPISPVDTGTDKEKIDQALQATGAKPLTDFTYGGFKSASELSSKSLTIEASPILDITKAKRCEEAFPDDAAKLQECRDAGGVVALVTAGSIALVATGTAGMLAAPAIIPVVASVPTPTALATAFGTATTQIYVTVTVTGSVLISKAPPVIQKAIQGFGVLVEHGDIVMDATTWLACQGSDNPTKCFSEHAITPVTRAGGNLTPALKAVENTGKESVEAGGFLGGARRLWNSASDNFGKIFSRGGKSVVEPAGLKTEQEWANAIKVKQVGSDAQVVIKSREEAAQLVSQMKQEVSRLAGELAQAETELNGAVSQLTAKEATKLTKESQQKMNEAQRRLAQAEERLGKIPEDAGQLEWGFVVSAANEDIALAKKELEAGRALINSTGKAAEAPIVTAPTANEVSQVVVDAGSVQAVSTSEHLARLERIEQKIKAGKIDDEVNEYFRSMVRGPAAENFAGETYFERGLQTELNIANPDQVGYIQNALRTEKDFVKGLG